SYDFGYNNLSLFAPTAGEPAVPNLNLRPQHTLSAKLAPGVELLGYDLLTSEFRAGDVVRLGLYLHVEEAATLTVAQVGADGRVVAEERLPLAPHEGIMRRQVSVGITPYTPAQSYHFELRGGTGEMLELADFEVTHTAPAVKIAEIPHPLTASMGAEIELLGYQLSGVQRWEPLIAHPGETLELTLYWQSPGPIERSYKIFTHLVGTEYNLATQGLLWAQDDQIPLEGAYPTNQWLPQIPLADHFELAIPPHTPPGAYQLTVGMYTLADGQRLPVTGEGAVPESGYILLTTLRIEP
ncbi:MAG TPA: hypothetical protein G4N98_04870, partial [Thermoflexia bacterium]|nr:hypothetical protein [Thermoflexia bacterium]